MKVYRYEKDLSGINGKSFNDVSMKGYRYFSKTFEGALMWGYFFNVLHSQNKIYDGYIVEYEINGEYFERQLNSLNNDEYKEIKINHSNCLLIKRTYIIIDSDYSIDEFDNIYKTPTFIEDYESPKRVWIKKSNKR